MTPFGFQWGPVKVERCATLPHDRRVVTITTDYHTLEVHVSATGRSVRVFERGDGWSRRELRAPIENGSGSEAA